MAKEDLMHSQQNSIQKEAALNMEKPGISHVSAKMAAKQDTTAEHGEAQHVVAAEAEAEEATTPEGEETSVSKEPVRANRAVRTRAHG